jgi:hypothetical protein
LRESVIPSAGALPRPPVLADLHKLSLSLARAPEVVAFARALSGRQRAPGRLARIAGLFWFVSHLVDVPPSPGEPRDGVDLLLAFAGEEEGPALILASLLLALGERASLSGSSGRLHVRVEIGPDDLARLPPYAQPTLRAGRCYVPLDPRRARAPLGFLPRSDVARLHRA